MYNMEQFKTNHKLTDVQAYIKYPLYNFVYNKLELIKSQNITCAPIGVYPQTYPIVIKPIINLFGMSKNVIVVNSDDEYEVALKDKKNPGSFWMPQLKGNHYTIDLFIIDSNIVFFNAFQSITSSRFKHKQNIGLFSEHIYIKNYSLPAKCDEFIKAYIPNYTGFLNIEIIDDIIIEIHLRWNGDNFIYRENDGIFLFLLNVYSKSKKTTNTEIDKRNKYDAYVPKTHIYRFKRKNYYYVPIFIEIKENTDSIKEIKEIKAKISNFILTYNKNGEIELNIYYDDIHDIKQNIIPRYCVVVFNDEQQKNMFIEYISN